ncbi:permease [Solimonas terrae]|uniref:Permease n=1 Tax=Solimonas terrae TaxID=1396819 RepID=A0A6M2BLD2_9GAMM|nr:permease [Solimonas terrae]NGY03298.1 permease [Solimonas terrae]
MHAVLDALSLSGRMFWQMFWGLNLGFALSAVIEVMISKDQMSRLMPDAGAASIARASLFGAVSSSCSYAAVAMARAVVRKGGDFTAAMCFQFAATNLVIELGVLMWVMLGWPFAAADFAGGIVMIVLVAGGLRLFVSERLRRDAVHHAKGDARGAMEGHAAMAMGKQQGSWRDRLGSRQGWIAVSHNYVMNWSMVWKDIAIGLLVAGALGSWVPKDAWQLVFLQDHGWLTAVWGAAIGPLIALVAFTCSVGNVPLAAVLWNGGIGFGGVIAFIFGDLIIPPLLNIYRKYYGGRTTWRLLVVFYLAMVLAALIVEGLFSLLGAIPEPGHVKVAQTAIELDYTAVLNLLLGGAGLTLAIVFARSGGPAMMRRM